MGANWVFLVFRRGGNVLFRVFRSSAVAETLLFLFFFFRPWPKACFSGFLLFGRGRKAKMGYFCFSKGLEMQKMGDFAFPRGWKRRKWGVFAFPRGWKRRKWGVFAFPRGWKRRKWGVFAFPRGWKRRKWGVLAFPRGWKRRKWGVFAFPRGWKRGFFPISDKKLRFFCSQRLWLSRNCDFFAPNGCFCPEIAIFRVSGAVVVIKSPPAPSRGRRASFNEKILIDRSVCFFFVLCRFTSRGFRGWLPRGEWLG